MTKEKVSFRKLFWASLIFLIAFFSLIPTLSFAEDTSIDVGSVGSGSAVSHTHIYQTFYDEHYHWQQCTVCSDIKSKTTHSLVGNGGSKTLCENGHHNTAYREVCSCGYQGKPQVVIHGRYSNYVNCQRLNYESMNGVYLSDIKQITKAEFNSITYPEHTGQSYTWEDPDGDGYGWVFCGGPILGDGYGVKGTLQIIIGTEGDYGRKYAQDEYFALARYIYGNASPTRSGFVDYLNGKINGSSHPTSHPYYGYNTKYQNKVSDAQFAAIVENFKGYYTHTAGWGWEVMGIQHSGHNNPGSVMYRFSGCFDSNKLIGASPYSGQAATCDMCGANFSGLEAYNSTTWMDCNAGNWLNDGESRTCSGHSLYVGTNSTYLGTLYCTFKRTGHTTTLSYRMVPATGGTVSGNSLSWTTNSDGSISSAPIECIHLDTNAIRGSGHNVGTCTIVGSLAGMSRELSCRYYGIMNDDTAPSAYGYSGKTSSNSYWQVIGNGSSSSLSTIVKIKATFKDPDQFSQNLVKIRVYDSDKSTLIYQASGASEMPLTRISGTAGTAGGDGIWQGTVELSAEVNGTKDVYIQAIDSTGRTSDLIPMTIQYLDSKGPEINIISAVNLNSWSKTKVITVRATDAFGTVYLGTSNEDLRLVSTDSYNNQRTYIINGNLYSGSKQITFYAKDLVGNVFYVSTTFSKLDSTTPTLSSGSIYDVFSGGSPISWKITGSGSDAGSGVVSYAITRNTTAPIDAAYQSSTDFSITESGDYYIWVKDAAGNVLRSEKITVHSDVVFNGKEIRQNFVNGKKIRWIVYNGKRLRL